MAELPSCYPSSPFDKRKKERKKEREHLKAVDKIQRKCDEIKESLPALTPPPVWAGTSRYQWPPGSPSPLCRTSPWIAAQRLAHVGICPLSIPWLFPPLSRASSAGHSIGCSGGRDVPASGPSSCLLRRTTSICRRLGVRTVSGTCPLARVRISVGRIWLPVASHYSLGLVSCSPLSLSTCSRDACCTCRPPTWPSLPSSLLRFVWPYSPPRCICVLVLCLLCGLLALGSPGDLLPHSLGCQCVPGPVLAGFAHWRSYYDRAQERLPQQVVYHFRTLAG